MQTKCDNDHDTTEALLTLVCCIEDLQAHVSYLFNQHLQTQSATAKAKFDILQAQQQVCEANRSVTRRHELDIKRLKASMRILCAQQRTTARHVRCVATKCNNRHRLSERSKTGTARNTSSRFAPEYHAISPYSQTMEGPGEGESFCQATRKYGFAHDRDLSFVMTNWSRDDATLQVRSASRRRICMLENGVVPREASSEPDIIQFKSSKPLQGLLSWVKPREAYLNAMSQDAGSLPTPHMPQGVTPPSERNQPALNLDTGTDLDCHREVLTGQLYSIPSPTSPSENEAAFLQSDLDDVPRERSISREGLLFVPAMSNKVCKRAAVGSVDVL